ncbi:hypothetical protein JCM14036_12540 [Desulfotomaculum defluvii]
MIEVYCDESRPETLFSDNTRDKYMIIGGIWLPYTIRSDVKDEIKRLKQKHKLNGEIKWKNVSLNKLDFYTELIDMFFDEKSLRFRCIVVDSELVDLDTYHGSDGELGFYKFYYQLLKHWVDEREDYWIYLDHKKNKNPDRLKMLRRYLDGYAAGRINDVQAINSKESLLIQLADVLTGAVGYRFHELNTSEAKLHLIDRIENNLGHRIYKTAKSVRKFNVFKIELR